MSTITRRKRTSRIDLGPYKRFELLTGRIFYPLPNFYTGYGDGSGRDVAAFVSDEMQADWEANREELMEYWTGKRPTAGKFLPWVAFSPALGRVGI